MAKVARDGLHYADHWPGVARPPIPLVGRVMRPVPQAVAAPLDRPLYPRGGTYLMPAPTWRTWAFLMNSREGSQAQRPPPPPTPPPNHPPLPSPVSEATRARYPGAQLMAALRSGPPSGRAPGRALQLLTSEDL